MHRIFAQSLGDNQDIFWQMWEKPLCSFLSAMAFALVLSHGCRFCLFLIVESWTLTLIEAGEALQFFRCCSGLFYDLLDESSLRSWSHHSSKFSPFVDNGSERGSLESQSLRNGLLTLSSLIHVKYFVSHLFLNLFRSRHDVYVAL